MQCEKCGFENAPQSRFCNDCGQRLAPPCPECGHENRPKSRFCGQCGSKLAGAQADARKPPRAAPGERRQLTVLFCDLVGSTDLSTRLDPEDLRDVVREYQLAASEVIERFGGHIAQYLGDGILVYFGYPRAYEDSPRRALNAGLGIIEALDELNKSVRPQYGVALHVRIGVHTGSGVVGHVTADGRRERLLIGRAPNVAAGLEGLAQTDQVVASQITHDLTRGFFSFEPLGEHPLKGLSETIVAHRVLAPRRVTGMMDLAVHRTLSPFTGRRSELAALLECFQRCCDGQGQIALVTGEAGLGKSRLVHSLRSQIGHEQAFWLTCAGSSYARNSAFHPLIEMFRGLLQVDPGQPSEANLDNLEKGLESYGQLLAEAVPLFALLLSIADDGRFEAPHLSPQAQREKTMNLLIDLLRRQSEIQPVVLMVEDLHWVDPSTLQFIDVLAENLSDARIFVLATYRPSFDERWLSLPSCLRIPLQPFTAREVAALVEKLSQGRPLPERLVQHLIDKTDGVPLFVEELTRAILESGLDLGLDLGLDSGTASGLQSGRRARASTQSETDDDVLVGIPTTLRDTLTARLDRLDPGPREIAQLASAVGRTFSRDLLLGVSSRDPATLDDELGRLVAADIVQPDESLSSADHYMFRQALLQDTAYHSMLRPRRRELHRTIARVLVEQSPELDEIQPELLALHHEHAGELDQAIDHLQRAGQRSIARSAHAEAINQLAHAIELVQTTADSPERDQREIQLRLTLGGGLIATKGYAAPEVQDNYSRAQELCSHLSSSVQLIPVLYGLWVFNLARSNRATTLEFAARLAGLSGQADEDSHELSAISANAITRFYAGELASARAGFERVSSLYRSELHGALVRNFGDDGGVYAEIYLAWLHLLAGRPETALARDQDARALATQLADPLAESTIGAFSMLLQHDLGDVPGTRTAAESLIALASEQGFPFWLALGRFGRGWSQVKAGEHDDGIAEIRKGLSFLQAIDQKLPATYWLSYLAEAYLDAGRFADGSDVITRAIAMAGSNMDSFYLPELHRLAGELSRGEGQPEQAMRHFDAAQTIARDFGARLLELRAAVSAGSLCLEQGLDRGALDHARDALVKLHDSFEEGADTHDLRRAAALIARLPTPDA